jgi:hypothetical protein
MKQFLLFAGTESARADGVNGLVGDFDSAAEAFVCLVDRQTPSQWWHVLDTQTGEVIDRQHLRTSNGMIGFQRSERIVGNQASRQPMSAPISDSTMKAVDHLNELEAGMRAVVSHGTRRGNGQLNGLAER